MCGADLCSHGHGHGHGRDDHGHDAHDHGVLGNNENNNQTLTDTVAADYNMNMQIAAVFIIMATSLFGTLLPIIGKRYLKSNAAQVTLVILKLFGAGVILATAFVHMFTSASIILSNERITGGIEYHSLAAVIALAGIFTTHLIQLLAGQAINSSRDASYVSSPSLAPSSASSSPTETMVKSGQVSEVEDDTDHHSHHAQHNVISENNVVDIESHATPQVRVSTTKAEPDLMDVIDHEGHTHSHGAILSAASREAQLVVFLLELGIASHSVIIGITLGVTGGEDFMPLFIALIFHQFFEGIALSAIVAEANFKRLVMTVGMVFFYTLTTPMGIVIGIVLKSFIQENHIQMAFIIGVLDAISAGILGYDGLVNVVVPHFKGKLFTQASGVFKFVQVVCMYLGAAGMSVVGIWA